jgi:hypothetical protein
LGRGTLPALVLISPRGDAAALLPPELPPLLFRLLFERLSFFTGSAAFLFESFTSA